MTMDMETPSTTETDFDVDQASEDEEETTEQEDDEEDSSDPVTSDGEEDDDSEDSSETAKSKEKPKKETAEPDYKASKHKVKIDGEEHEVEYDELVKGYNLNKVATQRMQEAASIRGQFETFMDQLPNNPELALKLLERAGMGEEQINHMIEERLWRKIQLEKMTPEQREAWKRQQETEHKAKSFDQLKAEQEARAQKEKTDSVKKQAYESIDTEVDEVLKLLGEKPTPLLIARIAEFMQISIRATKKLPERGVLAKKVRESIHQDRIAARGKLQTPEDVEQALKDGRLDEPTLKAIGQYQAKKASEGKLPKYRASQTATTHQKQQTRSNPKRMSVSDFFKV